MKKRFSIFLSLLAVIGFLHARQIWPVQTQDIVGVYQEKDKPQSFIRLKAGGICEYHVGPKKYAEHWKVNEWDSDITLVEINFGNGAHQMSNSYVVGSRFGHVDNLYLSNKLPQEWQKIAHDNIPT